MSFLDAYLQELILKYYYATLVFIISLYFYRKTIPNANNFFNLHRNLEKLHDELNVNTKTKLFSHIHHLASSNDPITVLILGIQQGTY